MTTKTFIKAFEYCRYMALQVNQYIDSGCLVFDENDDTVSDCFIINNDTQEITLGNVVFCGETWGHEKIQEVKNTFSQWRLVRPENIIKLDLKMKK